MKSVLLALLLSVSASAGDGDELDLCVSQLERYSQKLQNRIPAAVFSADRRLFHMTQAIPQLRSNGELAARSGSMILLANSLEGCRIFQARYESRAAIFQGLLACLAGLIGALTVRAFLIMFATPLAPGVTHVDLASRSAENLSNRDRG